MYLEPDLISLTKPSTCSVRAQSEQGIPVITKFIIYQSSSIHLRICWSRTLRSGEGVRNISYPPALAAGSETSRKGPECVKRRPQFPTFLRSSSRAPSYCHLWSPLKGKISVATSFVTPPKGKISVARAVAIFGYSCKSRISHPRLSLNIKAPRGLTIPRSRSSNFEAG